MNRLMKMTKYNVDGMSVHNDKWAQQLKDAMNVNGGDVENATAGDYVMHFLTFGFKVLSLQVQLLSSIWLIPSFLSSQIIFALIPPAGMGGGWPCFFVAIAMIGLLTAIVGDLAGIFGCLVGLKDSVTGDSCKSAHGVRKVYFPPVSCGIKFLNSTLACFKAAFSQCLIGWMENLAKSGITTFVACEEWKIPSVFRYWQMELT